MGPFVHVTLRDGGAVFHGQPQFFAGHRMPTSADEGLFASWQWQDGALRISSDRYGFVPLFYSERDGALIVSPSVQTLLERGASRTLDDAAIAAFVRLGFFLGEDTAFAGIRALPPGARLTWRAGRLEKADDRPPHQRALTIGRAEAMDEFSRLFAQAIARRIVADEPIILPLSGGKDSRHILLALRRAGTVPEECVTFRHYPPRANHDAVIAAELARRVGTRHVLLPPRVRRVDAEQEKNAATQFASDEHVQYLPLRDYLLQHRATVYDGIAGDMLTQSWDIPAGMFRAFKEGDVTAATDRSLEYEAPKIEESLAALLTGAASRRFNRELAASRLSAEVSRHMEAPNPPGAFYFWNRTRREIALAPYGLLEFLPRVFAPFLDTDLFNFLSALPVDLIADAQFHADVIRQDYPEFADMGFESAHSERAAGATAYARRTGRDLLWCARRPSAFVRRSYVASRAAAAWGQGDVNRLWFLPLAVWLWQIEALADGRSPRV